MRGVHGVITASLLCAVSCIPYYTRISIENPDDSKKTTFPGIRASLKTQKLVRLLVVHGMGTHGAEPHETTYAHALLQEIQRQLHLTTLSQCKIVDVLPTPFGASSTVDRCSYLYGDQHELRVYILTWSKLTEHFEDTILKPDWTKYGGKRVRINRALKEELIDKSFADAVLYAGAFAPTMRKSVARALCVLISDKTDPTADCRISDQQSLENIEARVTRNERSDIFLISHSLGSVMVIETLQEMLAPEPDRENDDPFAQPVAPFAAKQFISDLRMAALMANQLPLLYLSRIQKDGQVAPATEGEFLLSDELRTRSRRGCDPMKVVAFHDPNDLLTFPLPAGWRDRIARTRPGDEWKEFLGSDCATPGESAKVDIINVFLTNEPNRIFNVAVNPAPAHTKYWGNEYLVHFLVEGHAGAH